MLRCSAGKNLKASGVLLCMDKKMMNKGDHTVKRGGFTLIELMIVVARPG